MARAIPIRRATASTKSVMRFSGPDLRDLTRDAERFVRRRSVDDGSGGFNYVPRAWLETAITAYLEHGRNPAAATEAFVAAQPGKKGITPWKQQHAASMRVMLDYFMRTDQSAPRMTAILFRARPRLTIWYGHELAVRMDLWVPGPPHVLRVLWTDEKSRLDRRGTTARVAGLLAHAQPHLLDSVDVIEVWQLRYRQQARWRVEDLEPHLPRLRVLMDWAAEQLERQSA